MVTAELAACLPVLMLVLAVVVSAVSVVGARVRLQDAAREAARAGARGDVAAARHLAERAFPGADLSLRRSDDTVTAIARASVAPLGGWLPSVDVAERSVAAAEPRSDPP